MKAKAQSRFSIDALRDRAGDTVFVRGETNHRGGQVQILTVETNRVLAQVAGTEDHGTELRGRGRGIATLKARHRQKRNFMKLLG